MGNQPEAGADWDLDWLGVPDPRSKGFGHYEKKEQEREVREDGKLA